MENNPEADLYVGQEARQSRVLSAFYWLILENYSKETRGSFKRCNKRILSASSGRYSLFTMQFTLKRLSLPICWRVYSFVTETGTRLLSLIIFPLRIMGTFVYIHIFPFDKTTELFADLHILRVCIVRNLNKITDAMGIDCAFPDINISLQIDTLKKKSSMNSSILLFITIVTTS